MPETDDRREKLERLRAGGIEPFPHAFPNVTPIAELRAAHDGIEAGEELPDATYRIAGRLTQRRGMGGATFMDIVDRSGKIQLHAKRDDLGDESFDTLTALDLGDVLGVDGFVFKSRRGELSLRVTDWDLLAKALRAPPDKFHGLEDVETRYRHRELDLIANEDSRTLFIMRSKVVSA
ncbi:MAG TPA: OB-fold nucleic acid binding domain-containing protein, partial [Thermoleophilaceae bacterium]|nr:OB-fold nucleic acid binding domain-containing protein [Thermoleophilaceae bacterium]